MNFDDPNWMKKLFQGINRHEIAMGLLSPEETNTLNDFFAETDRITNELIQEYQEADKIPDEYNEDWVCEKALSLVPGAKEALNHYAEIDKELIRQTKGPNHVN